ncbi:collagen alpha-1(XII) chain-like [Mya arenaria]|uniref:collagen alpha-1(XII) chain-like n=1 Tax=Mya arenaria TaxID=6604 RepID=UPI0022E3E05D|nr:collagen alpha-1(XII) chain-like [Mya arenaria]
MIPSLLFLGFLVGSAISVDVCKDLDSTGCALFAASPDFCTTNSLADSYCKRTCNKCPLTCYHCPGQAVSDPSHCNTTEYCAQGELCVVRTLHANDGHYEHIMSCDDSKFCNGFGQGFGAIVGRRVAERDVTLHCCHNDLCNVPFLTTPRPTTPVITTPSPTIHSCNKDIVFVVDESSSIGYVVFRKVIEFIRDLVLRLDIGVHSDQVALLLYDINPHVQWYLHDYTNKASMLSALNYVPYHNGTSRMDLALRFVRQNVTVFAKGDRPSADNVIILLTDGRATYHQAAVHEASLLKQGGADVIAVGVHNTHYSIDSAELVQLASFHEAVILSSLTNNEDALTKMIKMICN